MDLKEFKNRFAILCACTKFPPKNEDTDLIWFQLTSKEMTDDQIILAFARSKNECDDFPSYKEFKELGTRQKNVDDETDLIVANVMRCIAEGSDPTKSYWVSERCGSIGYEAVGGSNGWYDIMNGYKRIREDEIRRFVKSRVKEINQERLELPSNVKGITNGRDANIQTRSTNA